VLRRVVDFAAEFPIALGEPLREEKVLAESIKGGVPLSEEEQLLEACCQGSMEAFERLYGIHAPRMKSVAFHLLGNRADAEDAVQEAFLRIYRSVSRFRGSARLSTWIYRIVINAAYDLMRRRRRLREVSGGPRVDEPAGGSDAPLRVALSQCLRAIPARQRDAFVLFEVEGFSHAEIADILEVPEGTSKTLLFRARQELRRRLAPAWEARS
jgi:RNA polymerase sigma-70 factor, ECF subfamily